MTHQAGFFDLSDRYESLSKFGDPLEKLASFIDFGSFRKAFERTLQFSNPSQQMRQNRLYRYKTL